MARLTDEQFWNEGYETTSRSLGRRMRRVLLGVARRVLSSNTYSEYHLWRRMLPRYLSEAKGKRAIEIGSAPGDFLVRLFHTFGVIPYGVDYAETGVALNRKTFLANGLNPEQVIHADFFSDGFLDQFRHRFDIVISRGFIEHFSDPKEVVRRHAELLGPGGLLLINIPNVRGINLRLQSWLRPEVIPLHNLEIMDLKSFHSLFDVEGLESHFCGYQGMFDWCLFNVGPNRFLQAVRMIGKGTQALLSPLLIAIFRNHPIEHRSVSPYLWFIGRMTPSR